MGLIALVSVIYVWHRTARVLANAVSALAICAIMNVSANQAIAVNSKRVPAEWEPQESVWLQWPSEFERVFQPAFAQMSAIISRYQKLNIVYHSRADLAQATKAIAAAGGDPDHANIVWHQLPNDSAWMRDNGPVYLVQDGELRILNWLVGNGFVIAVGFGDDTTDAAARKRIEGYFPGRDVHIIEMLASWYDGGGVHCHTNDQPAL